MKLVHCLLIGAIVGSAAMGAGIGAALQFYDQPALVEHLHPCPTDSPRSWPRVVEQPAAWRVSVPPASVEPLTLGPRAVGARMGQQAKDLSGHSGRMNRRPGAGVGAALGEAA